MIPMIDKEKTGRQLRYFMRKGGFTPRDIQEYLSLSCVQTVYRWFAGVNIPSIDNLYALSVLFGTGIDALVAGELEEVGFSDKLSDKKGRDARKMQFARLRMYGARLVPEEAA